MVRICFVCLGNICRSPTAEGVFKARLAARHPNAKVSIDSAGTAGYHVGSPADERSRDAAARRGYELTSRAAQFKREDFENFSLILAMDNENLSNLRKLCPESFTGELRLFRDFDSKASPGAEVPDPYYGGASGFENVLDICERSADGLIDHLTSSELI